MGKFSNGMEGYGLLSRGGGVGDFTAPCISVECLVGVVQSLGHQPLLVLQVRGLFGHLSDRVLLAT